MAKYNKEKDALPIEEYSPANMPTQKSKEISIKLEQEINK